MMEPEDFNNLATMLNRPDLANQREGDLVIPALLELVKELVFKVQDLESDVENLRYKMEML
jgi:hypothetical protein